MEPTSKRPIVARSKIQTDAEGKPIVKGFTHRGWNKLVPIQVGKETYPKNGFEKIAEYKKAKTPTPPEAKGGGDESPEETETEKTERLLRDGSTKPTIPEIEALIEEKDLMVPKGDLKKPELIDAVLKALDA